MSGRAAPGSVDASPDELAERRARAHISTLYLLSLRGEALAARAPKSDGPRVLSLLEGLQGPDRTVRARWLAHGLCDLLAELDARRLDRSC